jgi:hypothetical protein
MFSRIVTANSGDGVRLPPVQPGCDLMVLNVSGNPIAVYPSNQDQIEGNGAGNSVSMMNNSVVLFSCYSTASGWASEGLATGFSASGLQTQSYLTGITAHAGGGQGSAVPLTAMLNFISTVVTAGDSVILPSAVPGSVITVINQSSTATGPNVFPQSGQTINALAANTAIAVPPQSVLIFFCGISGSWWTK